MFVWCESFHGISTDSASSVLGTHDDLRSVYGINNIEVAGISQFMGIVTNYDNAQPGIRMGGFDSRVTIRMGPGISGGHRFTSQSDWYIHFAFNIVDDQGMNGRVLVIEDTTVFPSAMEQCRLKILNYGPAGKSLALYNNVTGTKLAETVSRYKQAGVYYAQLHVNIGTLGSSRLIVSGLEEWNVSGINTKNTINATANAITFGSFDDRELTGLPGTTTSNTTIGNIVIADGRSDGLTPSFDQLLGEFVVAKIQPNGNGDNNDFNPVGTGVTQNWQAVDDYMMADQDGTYNETSTSGNKDVMNYEDPNFILSGIVYGLTIRTGARKTDAGSRSLQHIFKPTTTEFPYSSHVLLSTYTKFSDVEDINPDTSVRYTDVELDAHQFGYKLL